MRKLRGDPTGDEVADGMDWSQSKISRIESARDMHSALPELAEDANKRAWWQQLVDLQHPLLYLAILDEAVLHRTIRKATML